MRRSISVSPRFAKMGINLKDAELDRAGCLVGMRELHGDIQMISLQHSKGVSVDHRGGLSNISILPTSKRA